VLAAWLSILMLRRLKPFLSGTRTNSNFVIPSSLDIRHWSFSLASFRAFSGEKIAGLTRTLTSQSLTSCRSGSVSGGTGIGAAFDTTWNPRALRYAGIAVVDAANVTITNNTSGSSAGNSAQRYGIALLHQFTDPSRLTMSGNTLSGNAVASVSPLMKAGGRQR
jgi:hypothetical protein